MFKIIIENQLITKVQYKIPSKILGKSSSQPLPSPPENIGIFRAGGIARVSLKQKLYE